MDLAGIISKYLMLVEEVIASRREPVCRDLSSRIENPINYVYEVEPQNPVFTGDSIIYEIDEEVFLESKHTHTILGVDGSSRAIDTPYMFIGIATVSIYSRLLGEVLDHPPLPVKYLLPPLNTPFMALSPDFPLDEKVQEIFTESPAGVAYTRDYNKALILDEIRTTLENKALLHIAENYTRINNISPGTLIVFIDGPVYPVPNLFRQHYSLVTKSLPSRGRLDDYVASWKELLKQRFEAINALERQGAPIIGIVKRVESSRLLLSTKDYIELIKDSGLWVGDLGNDQAFIDSVIRMLLSKRILLQPYKPMYIGPIHVPAEATYIHHYIDNVPKKTVYYMIVPLNKYGAEKMMYTLFRVETTEHSLRILEENNIHILKPVLEDSVFAGTTLPISILYADKRSKTLSRSLANIIARDLERRGVPLTYDTIRTIEAYSIGS